MEDYLDESGRHLDDQTFYADEFGHMVYVYTEKGKKMIECQDGHKMRLMPQTLGRDIIRISDPKEEIKNLRKTAKWIEKILKESSRKNFWR